MVVSLFFEMHQLPAGRTTMKKDGYGSATVARCSGFRGRNAGKACAHDHQKSKEISTRQFVQIRECGDLVREILSRPRRSAETCSARSQFRNEREAGTHRAG